MYKRKCACAVHHLTTVARLIEAVVWRAQSKFAVFLRTTRMKTVKSRRSRSCCSYSFRPKENTKKVRRSRSLTKNRPVEPFTTLVGFLCSVFHCAPQDLDTIIPTNFCFVRRLLRNNFPEKGLMVKGKRKKFHGLRWLNGNRPTSWRPLKYPHLPMIILHHVASGGIPRLSVLPLELFYISKFERC